MADDQYKSLAYSGVKSGPTQEVRPETHSQPLFNKPTGISKQSAETTLGNLQSKRSSVSSSIYVPSTVDISIRRNQINTGKEAGGSINIEMNTSITSQASVTVGSHISEKRRSFSASDIAFVKEIPFPIEKVQVEKCFTIEINHNSWSEVWDMKKMKPKGDYPQVLQQALAEKNIPCSYFSNGYQKLTKDSKLGAVKLRGYCKGGGKTAKSSKDTCMSQIIKFISVSLPLGILKSIRRLM